MTRSWFDREKLQNALKSHAPTKKEALTPSLLSTSTKARGEFRTLLEAVIHSRESDEVALAKLARGVNKAWVTEKDVKTSTSYQFLLKKVEAIVGYDLIKGLAGELKAPEAIDRARNILQRRENYEEMFRECSNELPKIRSLWREARDLDNDLKNAQYNLKAYIDEQIEIQNVAGGSREALERELRSDRPDILNEIQRLEKNIINSRAKLEARKAEIGDLLYPHLEFLNKLVTQFIQKEYSVADRNKRQSDPFAQDEKEQIKDKFPSRIPYENKEQYDDFVRNNKERELQEIYRDMRVILSALPSEEAKFPGGIAPSAPEEVGLSLPSAPDAEVEPEETSPPIAFATNEDEPENHNQIEGVPNVTPSREPLETSEVEGMPRITPTPSAPPPSPRFDSRLFQAHGPAQPPSNIPYETSGQENQIEGKPRVASTPSAPSPPPSPRSSQPGAPTVEPGNVPPSSPKKGRS